MYSRQTSSTRPTGTLSGLMIITSRNEGNKFTGVCLSTGGEGVPGLVPGGCLVSNFRGGGVWSEIFGGVSGLKFSGGVSGLKFWGGRGCLV